VTTYPEIRSFNEDGLRQFIAIMDGSNPSGQINPLDAAIAMPVAGTSAIKVTEYPNRKAMAVEISKAFGSLKPEILQHETGIWTWLTWILREQLFDRDPSTGQLKVGEEWVWNPANPSNYQKAQRHKVRLPVVVWSTLGGDADHLLHGPVKKPGELIAQLTSQQDMLAPSFQRLCRKLYFDDARGRVKRGAAGSGAGSARRLSRIRKQLDITWDMSDLDTEAIAKLLPSEFAKFLGTSSGTTS
jgi:hypothetical protein